MENEPETLVKFNPDSSQNTTGDLLVKSRLYNAVLYDAVKRSGLTQKEYAESLGFNVNFLSEFITLRGSPWYQHSYNHGEPRPQAQRIALHIGMPFDEVFPRSLYALRKLLPVEFLSRRYVSTELVPLLEARNVRELETPSTLYERKELDKLVENALSTLTPREEKVIKMRFGLEDGKTHSLGEIGQSFARSRTRISQIEAKALRKLRHSSRSDALKDFVPKESRAR